MAAEGARHNKMRNRLTEMAIGKTSERTTCKDLVETWMSETGKRVLIVGGGNSAVGDIASDLALVVMAVAHGATVAHNAYIELRKPYWR
jgi:thioredoxin reductase